jgi:lysophospholipase L1-like esterase
MSNPRKINSMFRSVTILVAFWAWSGGASSHAAILPRLEQGESLTICAIGTSLTGDYFDPDAKAGKRSAWFPLMGEWLNSLYPGKVTLFNEGIGGAASKFTATYKQPGSGLDVQLDKALAHNPDVLFIEFGANDSYSPFGISPQASKANLQAMIDRTNAWAKSHGKKVDIVLQTMNNTPGEHAAVRPNLEAYYQVHRDVTAANGLLLVDHYVNWLALYNRDSDHATWKSYMSNNIHPNELGAKQVILPEIQRALKRQASEPTTPGVKGERR